MKELGYVRFKKLWYLSSGTILEYELKTLDFDLVALQMTGYGDLKYWFYVEHPGKNLLLVDIGEYGDNPVVVDKDELVDQLVDDEPLSSQYVGRLHVSNEEGDEMKDVYALKMLDLDEEEDDDNDWLCDMCVV